ncbi:MAG: PaaI family thioesterase [Bacteroidetes bacterium]|nr:MAG: PaaI family thioesterase [Bacteroidota bacterium]
MTKSIYFQDYMPENVCFGCGVANPDGLQIKSFWQGERALCVFHSQQKYNGWKNLLNGGIMATIIDCHCMNTAMAAAYKAEGRELDSLPAYRYATGTLTVKYLKPTPNDLPIEFWADVLEIKNRKTVLGCEVWVDGIKTGEAQVIAIRVADSSTSHINNPFMQ